MMQQYRLKKLELEYDEASNNSQDNEDDIARGPVDSAHHDRARRKQSGPAPHDVDGCLLRVTRLQETMVNVPAISRVDRLMRAFATNDGDGCVQNRHTSCDDGNQQGNEER